ncbi:hypothetical protein ACQQCD_05700 [Pseudarthrobacter sp. J1763]|uniref:hypothetical protein n=1 Tax=Pseudarthrobacter sp. J1763 TaxID=3420445 RepID=UPI003D2E3BA9
MSAQYTVRFQDLRIEGIAAATLASLPESFCPASQPTASNTEQQPDVVILSGHAGWTRRALDQVNFGTPGIVVVHPVPEDTAALQHATNARKTTVVLDHRWASNPALVAEAAQALNEYAEPSVLLDSVATAAVGTDPGELFSEQVTGVVRVSGPLQKVRILRTDSHGYSASAQLANGAPAALQGVLTNARSAVLTVNLLTSDGGVQLSLPEPAVAAPATVRITNSDGERLLPTLYESAHRASWRRLYQHLQQRTSAPDLDDFAALAHNFFSH